MSHTSLRAPPNLRLIVLLGVAFAACRSQPPAAGAPPAGDAGRRDQAVRIVPVAARTDARPPEIDDGQPGVEGLSPEQRAAAQRFEAKYCRKRARCATGAWPFGPDRRGRRIAVIAIESNE